MGYMLIKSIINAHYKPFTLILTLVDAEKRI